MSTWCAVGRSVVMGSGAERRITPARLEVRDGLICRAEVLDEAGYQAARHDAEDLEDTLVTPAFIDAHTHLALGFLRGVAAPDAHEGNLVEDFFYHYESRLTEDDVAVFAEVAAYESLASGVGLVWDHYYFPNAVVAGARQAGLTTVMAPTLQDVGGPGAGRAEAYLKSTLQIDDSDDPGVFAALGPHATDTVSAHLWRQLMELEQQRGLPLHFHVAQSADEYQRAMERHGKSPIAWLDSLGVLQAQAALLVHGLFVTAEDLGLLDPKRQRLVFCPSSQMVFGFPARTRLWESRGIEVVLGTDCSASNDSWNLQKELRSYAGRGAWAASFDERFDNFFGGLGTAKDLETARVEAAEERQTSRVLRTVWEGPGCMHPKFRAGTIEVGALANLALWDTTHPAFFPNQDPLATLAFGDTSGALVGMMTAGRRIGTWGQQWQAELRESARDASARAKVRVDRILAG